MPEVLSCLIPTLRDFQNPPKQILRARVKGKGVSRLPHSTAAEVIAPRVALERIFHLTHSHFPLPTPVATL